jgi:DNA-binding response OmpR family regulator
VANVLVVSGEAATQETLRSCLVDAGHLAAVCSDLSAAPRLFAALEFDVICLDVRGDGPATADFWAWFVGDQSRAAIPVLFILPLGARWTPAAATARFRPSCDDVVSRPLDIDDVRQKIARVVAASPSGPALRSRVLRSPPFTLDIETHDLAANGEKIALTPIEHRLLAYLMERPGAIVGSDELLESVWGFQPGTATAAVVRVHVGNLRRKMAQLGTARLLGTLPHRGYRLLQEEGS